MVGQHAWCNHYAARVNAKVIGLPDQRVGKAHGLLLSRVLQLAQHFLWLGPDSPPGVGMPRVGQQVHQPIERLVA